MSKLKPSNLPDLDPAELGPPPVVHFRVVKGGQFITRHQITTVPTGIVVSRLTHDLDSLREQGIELRGLELRGAEVESVIEGPLGTQISVAR